MKSKKIFFGKSPKFLRLNNKGAALILSYLVLTVLLTLSVGFAVSATSELNSANLQRDRAQAFWLAEAGINRFIEDTTILDGGDQTVYLGNGYFDLTKDDTDPTKRIVTATGTINGVTRQLKIEFPANPPDIFNDTMASGGNIRLLGLFAKLEVFGPTRITGSYSKSGFGASGWFEDKQEGVSEDLTTLKYPDADESGTPDEFNDFVEFNRDLVSTYDASEVVYIQSDSTQLIIPNSGLADKKIVYVEGSAPGSGDVDILFDASWQSDQNLTVISTGDVDYIQPLQFSSSSQLNIIAWDDYEEASILYSTHSGVTYAHDDANFYSIFAYSETSGNLVANEGINANEALAWKRFLYNDPLTDGMVPPGFEGLISQSSGGYSSTPNVWEEI